MARVNIQLDLKESDFLDNEVKKEVKGIARNIARETMKEELKKEIERIVDHKLTDAKKGEYYSSVITEITRAVSQRISNDIKLDSEKLNEIIMARVESYLDSKMGPYGGFDKFIEVYINKSIAQALTKK